MTTEGIDTDMRFITFREWLVHKEAVTPTPGAPKPSPKAQADAIDATKTAIQNKVKTSGGMATPADIVQNPEDQIDVAGDAAKQLAQKGDPSANITTTLDTVTGMNKQPGAARMRKR
jgi:hypothetical protein